MAAANNAINNTVGASVSGVTNTLTVTNPSDTASSQALTNITVGGTSAGDPFLTYTVAGTTNWSEGIDNSDSDAYVLSASSALGTTNVIRASTAGEVTKPLQPAFLAYLASSDLNQTGDSTVFTLGSVTALTEIFDQGGDFVTTGTFTAPVTGRYFFNGVYYIGGVLSTHTNGYCQIVTTNRNYSAYTLAPSKVFAVSTNMQMSCTAFADVDAVDTVTFQIQIINGTKVVDIIGGANADCYFSGCLIC